MTGAEPPLTSAAWSAAFGALVIGTVTPDGTMLLLIVSLGVGIGVVTRRSLATGSGSETSIRTELGLSFVEVFIALALVVERHWSGLSAVGVGIGVGAAGKLLIEPLVARFVRWALALLTSTALPTPMQPSAPATIVNAGVDPVMPGHDPDQDLIDKLGDAE